MKAPGESNVSNGGGEHGQWAITDNDSQSITNLNTAINHAQIKSWP